MNLMVAVLLDTVRDVASIDIHPPVLVIDIILEPSVRVLDIPLDELKNHTLKL